MNKRQIQCVIHSIEFRTSLCSGHLTNSLLACVYIEGVLTYLAVSNYGQNEPRVAEEVLLSTIHTGP